MDQKQMAKADFLTSIFLIAGSLFIVIYVLLRFPKFPEWGGIYSNPGFVPVLLGLTLLVMGIQLLLRSLVKQGYQIRASGKGAILLIRSQKVIRLLICFGLFILYYFLLGRLPFIVDTGLYLFLSIMIFGQTRWYKALLIALAVSLAVYVIFLRIFLVPLPRGAFEWVP